MAVERMGSKTDVVVKLVLVFFVSLLAFSIGTFVGKKFSDNQHKLAQFEPEANGSERGVASINPENPEVKPKDALSDDEIAKLAEEFISDDGTPKTAPAAKAPAEETEKTDKNATTHTEAKAEPTNVAKRVAQGMPPESEVKEMRVKSRIPQSLPKEVANSALGKYTVQIASYPEETDAQKMASDLKDKGFSAFYVPAKIKDHKSGAEKTWFRVSVGLFNTAKEADAYKKDLLNRAKVASAIVQKITQ
jgi:cell division protein FtsN